LIPLLFFISLSWGIPAPVRGEDTPFLFAWREDGRYGYRRITALLNNGKGWMVNHKRVERIWRREGLRIPKKQTRTRG
jgi:hypothetical protein